MSKIDYKGKTYILDLPTSSVIALEEKTGKGLLHILTMLEPSINFSVGMVCKFLWACLLKHNEVSEDEAVEMVDTLGLEAFNEPFAEAIEKSTPWAVTKDNPENPPQETNATTS